MAFTVTVSLANNAALMGMETFTATSTAPDAGRVIATGDTATAQRTPDVLSATLRRVAFATGTRCVLIAC